MLPTCPTSSTGVSCALRSSSAPFWSLFAWPPNSWKGMTKRQLLFTSRSSTSAWRPYRQMHGQGCKARELEVLPKHLLRFLHQDLNKVREKHFQGTTGEAWLLAASYVDPRFRGHSMWEKMSKKEVKEMICKMVVESHEKYPELRERLRKAAEDPMNHKLETLGRPEPKKTRGRGRGRGRGAGRQEKPKSTSEAILRDAACAAASGPAVRLQPGPRALKERTSAEDWLFGPLPDRGSCP